MMERKFSILCSCSLLSQPAGHFCLAPPPPPPFHSSCNLHYFTKWGTVSRPLAAYENQVILFCFAAAAQRSSHSTGIPAETGLRCLLPAVYVYPVCFYMLVQYTMQYRRPYSEQNRCYILVYRANELRIGRGARDTFPRRACMSGSSRSLCPFPFACLKNAKK